jgi:predicted ATPase
LLALHRLTILDFRSLAEVCIGLGPLNVLAGPNGAGKSNLLEVISFLGDLARLDLGPAIDRHGGWEALCFRGERKTDVSPMIAIIVEAQVTRYSSAKALDHYKLFFNIKDGRIYRSEDFQFKRTQGRGRRITISGDSFTVDDSTGTGKGKQEKRALSEQSSGLATLQRLGDEEGAPQVKEIARLFESFRVFDPDVAAARRPSAELQSNFLRPDASNLAAFLHWLAKNHKETFELLQDDLREIVPGLQALHFEAIGGAAEATRITLEEAGLRGRTDLAHASFGTVRALALLAMLHDPNPPKLSCIEEIDHGLHPHVLDKIVERLRSASQRTQLLLATHSPTFINRLTPEEVIICERDPKTGASRIPAITQEQVAEILAGDPLGLGELWFTGTLGGVP